MNITSYIETRRRRDLLAEEGPLNLLLDEIRGVFKDFVIDVNKEPVVTTTQNFDELLIPEDHVSRSLKDTYYVDKNHVLRTHTSAHQTQHLRYGHRKFLVIGDCYRRDTIDATHYPVFHQLEGVKLRLGWGRGAAETDLKLTIEEFIKHLLPDVKDTRWTESYFPFTDPSFELEILYHDEWLEVLGCGLVENPILEACDYKDYEGWAFGIGLERLAMIRFQIPDIRLFWTEDERYKKQFRGKNWFDDFVFEPYSKYPPCNKDISFWCGPDFHENDLMAIVKNWGADMVEEVKMIDQFIKDGKISRAYRIVYRSMDRSLSNQEINAIQEGVRADVLKLDVELR
tara:strand:+ start:5384 stop:6409 length:1026 start_codon:yes stop_codon:yes gene_type:complete